MIQTAYLLVFSVLSFAVVGSAWADETLSLRTNEALSSWSLGVAVSGLGSDWGSGIALATPSLGHSAFSLALSETSFSYGLATNYDFTYENVALTLVTRNVLSEHARVYERFGFGAILPSSELSGRVGMNALLALGFEFYPAESGTFAGRISFVGELGVSLPFLNAQADRIRGAPRYAGGALTSVGTRYYF